MPSPFLLDGVQKVSKSGLAPGSLLFPETCTVEDGFLSLFEHLVRFQKSRTHILSGKMPLWAGPLELRDCECCSGLEQFMSHGDGTLFCGRSMRPSADPHKECQPRAGRLRRVGMSLLPGAAGFRGLVSRATHRIMRVLPSRFRGPRRPGLNKRELGRLIGAGSNLLLPGRNAHSHG